MFAVDYVLAVILLMTPPDKELPANLDLSHLGPAIQQLALAWELLDSREVSYMLVRRECFADDLRVLRQRYVELADAPLLHDAVWLPSRETISDLLAFNRAYRRQMELRQGVEIVRQEEYQVILNETDQLYYIWDAVRDARSEYYYISVRRGALKKLRTAIGEEAYYGGKLPPHVPLWRFQRIE
jgi:hypothetical protein